MFSSTGGPNIFLARWVEDLVRITACEVAPLLPDGNAELADTLSVRGGDARVCDCVFRVVDCLGAGFWECIPDRDVPASLPTRRIF